MIGLQVFRHIPTSLDINGPLLSFTTQPVGITTSTTNTAIFVGIATATFPTQTPPNPATNTGYISYQWYEVGVGVLSNSSTISGAGTTTLVVSGLRSPNDSGRKFYVKANYIASAYNTTGITTVGTARSTGNAINNGLDSDIAILSIYPTLAISNQPLSKTVSGSIPATFDVTAVTSDSSDSSLIYNWLLNGNLLTDSANVKNSNTNKLTLSLPARYDTTVYHEISPGEQNVTTVLNVTNTGDFKASVSANNIGGAVFNGLDPGTTLNNNNRRYYDVNFQSDIGTTNYDVEVTNIIPISAKGTPDSTIGVGYISKRTNGFRIWFYRSGDFVCAQPAECLLYVWPPTSGAPTDTSVSGSRSNSFQGMSINVGNPASFSQQITIATGINYSGTFTFSGTMNNHSPSKTTEFRIRAVLPNGTTVATSGGTSAGANGSFSISLNFGPLSTLEPLNLIIDARFPDNSFQGGVNVSSSNVTWSGTYRTYQGTVYTVDTHVRGFKISLLSSNKVQARISHPTANNSPIFSNIVDYNIVSARSILNYELLDGSANQYGFGSANLIDSSITFSANSSTFTRTLIVYAPEKDITVRMTMAAAAGSGRNGNRGGEGGISVFTLTLRQNQEYVFKLGAQTLPSGGANGGGGGAFFYRKGQLLVSLGGGGGAGTQGRGGDGGGIGVGGENGFGRNAGFGGILFAAGTLPVQGFFAGGATSGGINYSATTGGRVSSCSIGDYWAQQGIAPCNDIGNVQFRGTAGQIASSSAFILRGYKNGTGYRNNGGNASGDNGGGGSGTVGGNAGTGSGSGGGGGSGYTNGEVNIISTRLGGNSNTEGYVTIEYLS